MKIATKHEGVVRDLERLIKNPKLGIEVTFEGMNGAFRKYDVKCKSLLDLAHEVRYMSDHTVIASLG